MLCFDSIWFFRSRFFFFPNVHFIVIWYVGRGWCIKDEASGADTLTHTHPVATLFTWHGTRLPKIRMKKINKVSNKLNSFAIYFDVKFCAHTQYRLAGDLVPPPLHKTFAQLYRSISESERARAHISKPTVPISANDRKHLIVSASAAMSFGWPTHCKHFRRPDTANMCALWFREDVENNDFDDTMWKLPKKCEGETNFCIEDNNVMCVRMWVCVRCVCESFCRSVCQSANNFDLGPIDPNYSNIVLAFASISFFCPLHQSFEMWQRRRQYASVLIAYPIRSTGFRKAENIHQMKLQSFLIDSDCSHLQATAILADTFE